VNEWKPNMERNSSLIAITYFALQLFLFAVVWSWRSITDVLEVIFYCRFQAIYWNPKTVTKSSICSFFNTSLDLKPASSRRKVWALATLAVPLHKFSLVVGSDVGVIRCATWVWALYRWRKTCDEQSENQAYPTNTIYEFNPLGEFFSAADTELGVSVCREFHIPALTRIDQGASDSRDDGSAIYNWSNTSCNLPTLSNHSIVLTLRWSKEASGTTIQPGLPQELIFLRNHFWTYR